MTAHLPPPHVDDLGFARPERVRAAIIQPELLSEHFREDRDLHYHADPTATWRRLSRHLRLIYPHNPDDHPRLVVLPELSVPLECLANLQKWSRRTRTTVIGGSHYEATPSGRIARCPIIVHGHIYFTDKLIPSPFEKSAVGGNSLLPGTNVRLLINSPVGNIAVAVCADFLSDHYLSAITTAASNLDVLCVIACQRETTKYSSRLHNFVENSTHGVYALYCNLDYQTYGDGHSAVFATIDSSYRPGLARAGYTDLAPTSKIAEVKRGESHIVVDLSLIAKKPQLPRSVASEPNAQVLVVSPNPRQKRLFSEPHDKILFAAFDLDGTLLRFPRGHSYSWSLVFEHLGIPDDTRRHFMRQYQSGDLSYGAWCETIAELFRKKGLSRKHVSAIASETKVVANLESQIRRLKQHGIGTALISGGIDALLYATISRPKSLFDECWINRATFSSDGYFQHFLPTPHDFDGKASALRVLASRGGISLNNIAFVGDSINDIKAMHAAGLSISFCTRDTLKDVAMVSIVGNDMRSVADAILHYNARRDGNEVSAEFRD